MELRERDFRAMIYYDFLKGLSQAETLESLSATFGKIAPKKTTVYKLFHEFKQGRKSLQDGAHPGRPPSVVNQNNIDAVEKLVKQDPRITCRDLQDILGIGSAAVDTILHKHLGLRKRCARWVPHSLTEDQKRVRVEWCMEMMFRFQHGHSKNIWEILTGDETWIYQFDPLTKQQSSVWLFPDESTPVKFRRSRSTGKKMVAAFFSKSGHIATVPLEGQRTVTSQWYVEQCLPLVFTAWRQRRPNTGTRGLLLHHDNASAHTAVRTTEFIASEGVQLLSHPPYSPDLAPCDFFLFPHVKKQIRGTRYESPDDAVGAFTRAVEGINENVWIDVFRQWFDRMSKCILAQGGYFEKLA